MKVKREIYRAGKTEVVSIRATSRIKTEKGTKRKEKVNPTTEQVAKNNLRYAIKELTIKINHNFVPGDYHLTLTYQDYPEQKEAKRRLKNFLANVRRACQRQGIVFKRIAVTEFENKKIHHHIVCTAIDLEIIKKYWKYGFERITPLDDTGNYYKLAEYLVKETEKTFRKEGCVFKKRYSPSRNLVMPEPKIEIVSERILRQDLKESKGFYIDQDTVRRYEHAILGVECVEYIQVSLGDNHTRRVPGKKGRLKEVYRIELEEQLSMVDNLPF